MKAQASNSQIGLLTNRDEDVAPQSVAVDLSAVRRVQVQVLERVLAEANDPVPERYKAFGQRQLVELVSSDVNGRSPKDVLHHCLVFQIFDADDDGQHVSPLGGDERIQLGRSERRRLYL